MSESDFNQGGGAERRFGQSTSGSSYSSIALSGMAGQAEASPPTLLGKTNSMPALMPEEDPTDLDYSPQLFTDMLTAPSSSPLKGASSILNKHNCVQLLHRLVAQAEQD